MEFFRFFFLFACRLLLFSLLWSDFFDFPRKLFPEKDPKCLKKPGLHHIIRGVREHSQQVLHASTRQQARRVNHGCFPGNSKHYD